MKTHFKTHPRHWALAAAIAIGGISMMSCGRENPQAAVPSSAQAQPVDYPQPLQQPQQPQQPLTQAPVPQPVYAPAPAPLAPAPVAAPAVPMLADSQLSDLTSSIALYPDPLIAAMLPAATYPDQVTSANQWLAAHPNPSQLSIDVLPFDPSVKELMHYPPVLTMMAQNPAWSQSLGMAFVYQQPALMDSIQRWRATALADNTLFSTPQIQVVDAPGNIQILPAAPNQVYVPMYDPSVVYVHHDRPENLLRFGPIAISGNFLDHDVDWGHHQVREPNRDAANKQDRNARDRNARPDDRSAPSQRRVFTRSDFHQEHYPDRIVTPQDHRVITPAARGADHPGDHSAPAARGGSDRGGDHGPADRGDDHRGEENNH
jgi:hypothetical protein